MSTANRGFGSMSKERRREIAAMGGRAAHASGTGHEFTSEEAREAGRKGGLARMARFREVKGKQDERERTPLPAGEE